MRRLTILLACSCLVGCNSNSNSDNGPLGFEGRQQQLFHEIDHQLISESCQELMRSHQEGQLSGSTYFCDDTAVKLSELPEPIRALEPTYVQVLEIWVQIGFLSDNGMQSLMCISNAFGPPPASEGGRGVGYREAPPGMDTLSGEESLDYLNANYSHFEMELVPGLQYQVLGGEQPATLEELKQSMEGMDALLSQSLEIMDQLVVKKRRLLYQTDHRELLDACRQVLTHHDNGLFSADQIDVRDAQFAADLKHIPPLILDLEPVSVWFLENRVRVALIGGLDHAGAIAYRDREDVPPGADEIELADGLLYYYDDGLREADDDYRDYLASLAHEAVPYLNWKQKQMKQPLPEKQ